MQIDLTQGPITRTMLRFAVPMICGNLLQQLYNVVDTLIVGQYLGANALAAGGAVCAVPIIWTSILHLISSTGVSTRPAMAPDAAAATARSVIGSEEDSGSPRVQRSVRCT